MTAPIYHIDNTKWYNNLFMFELKKINRWLKWTGWRLTLEVDPDGFVPDKSFKPSKIGLTWWGWSRM